MEVRTLSKSKSNQKFNLAHVSSLRKGLQSVFQTPREWENCYLVGGTRTGLKSWRYLRSCSNKFRFLPILRSCITSSRYNGDFGLGPWPRLHAHDKYLIVPEKEE